MEEGSGAADYNMVLELFQTANESGYDQETIRKKLDQITETASETLSFATYASAILEGTFHAVQRHATVFPNPGGDFQPNFDAVLEDYGPILASYASTKATQIRLIGCVERICLNPVSPFAPFFGETIQTLANHFISNQAIAEWKANRQAQEAAGTLTPGEVLLLRAIEAIPLMMNVAPLEGLGEEDEIARDMGL